MGTIREQIGERADPGGNALWRLARPQQRQGSLRLVAQCQSALPGEVGQLVLNQFRTQTLQFRASGS